MSKKSKKQRTKPILEDNIKSYNASYPYVLILYSSDDSKMVYNDVFELQKRGLNVKIDLNIENYTQDDLRAPNFNVPELDHYCKGIVIYISRHAIIDEQVCRRLVNALDPQQTRTLLDVASLPIVGVFLEDENKDLSEWITSDIKQDLSQELESFEIGGNPIANTYDLANLILFKLLESENITILNRFENYETFIPRIRQLVFTPNFLWYKTHAANQDDPYVHQFLGYCYYYGLGVEQDYFQAVNFFRSSAQSGNKEAQFYLGKCYQSGNGVMLDELRAHKLFKQAAENGNCDASLELGRNYINVDLMIGEAIKWFTLGSQQGNNQASYELGNLYSYDYYVELNLAESIKWYTIAADQGNREAAFELGELYGYAGLYDDYSIMGENYITNGGKVILEPNIEEAIRWYTLAGEKGHVKAAQRLGLIYQQGITVDQSFTQAIYWYERSARKGNRTAKYYLGYCYQVGFENYVRAFNYFKSAAEEGLRDAKYLLGVCYFNGEGVERNFSQALNWFEKAAFENHFYAQYFIAYCYEMGLGCEKDLTKAKKWYRSAADHGINDALNRLKTIQV